MSGETEQAAETRWVIIGSDGRHITLGRHTDPCEPEIDAAETALRAADEAGWLAVMRGRYYSRRPVELLMVRPLAAPTGTWEGACAAFDATRQAATRSS